MVWTLWPNVLPVNRLDNVLQRLRFCHGASLEGGQHLGMPCLFPFLPFLSLGFPLLFSVIKLMAVWIISSKEAAGFCCCSYCNFILMSDAHRDRNLSFKITCSL